MDMDCKKNAEEVKTESLHSSTAGSSTTPSSEGAFILGWKLLLPKCEIWLEINLHVHEEIPKSLGYHEIQYCFNYNIWFINHCEIKDNFKCS